MARRRSRLSPLAFVRRMGLYKGLLGGSRGWLITGGLVWAPRLLRKLFGRTEEVVSTEVLSAGQFVQLASVKPPSRRQKRAVARAEKAEASAARAARKAAKAARTAARRSA